jgi:hypothetical protein
MTSVESCISLPIQVDEPMEQDASVQKKNFAFQEIIQSERTYINMLNILRSHYMNPIARSKTISAELYKTFFGDIETITTVNERFLLEMENIERENSSENTGKNKAAALRRKSFHQATGGFELANETVLMRNFKLDAAEDKFTQIARLFIFFNQSFKLYTSYIANYPSAISTLSKEKKKNPDFKELLVTQVRLLRMDRSSLCDLEGFLIMPIQRLPRYVILLQTLLDNTDFNELSYPFIEEAKGHMEKIAAFCNERQKQYGNYDRMMEIIDDLSLKNFVIPTRKLLAEHYVIFSARELNNGHIVAQEEQCDLYIFTDVLVCSFKDKTRVYTLKKHEKDEATGLIVDNVIYMALGEKDVQVTIMYHSEDDMNARMFVNEKFGLGLFGVNITPPKPRKGSLKREKHIPVENNCINFTFKCDSAEHQASLHKLLNTL